MEQCPICENTECCCMPDIPCNKAEPQQAKNYATIPGFESLSAQQIFEMSATHLLNQGVKSIGADDMCLYRGPNGAKCAAGILLTDEGARRCEGETWTRLRRDGDVPTVHAGLITQLQMVHDTTPPIRWRVELRKVAFAAGLDASFMDKIEGTRDCKSNRI